jgi:hypothetical protein
VKKGSTRKLLEAAMDAAENNRFDEAAKMCEMALKNGASARNVQVTRDYIESFRVVQVEHASPSTAAVGASTLLLPHHRMIARSYRPGSSVL